MRKSVLAIAAALCGLSAAPAAAETVSVEIFYADLDLSSPAGIATLKQRIEAAADRVCDRPSMRDLKAMAAWQECTAAARADAASQLSALVPSKSPALATLF